MDDSILVDANAPLAGKKVIYDIELLEIVTGGNA
jgi:FKBP-type peptidyl-prolyl cis-trans isomerase 2